MKFVKWISSIAKQFANTPSIFVTNDESKWDKSTLIMDWEFSSKKKPCKVVILG